MGVSGGILLTGAGGFIGERVRAALGQQGAGPRVLAQRRPPAELEAGEIHLPLDLAAPLPALPAGLDAVLHMAGEKRDEARMDAVNHVGALRFAEASAAAGAGCFVLLSSVGVYGAPMHSGCVDESWPHTPANAYERSKHAGEEAVRARCRELGLRCIVLQPATVLGLSPGRPRPLLGLARTVARRRYVHVGAGDAWVNYVSVDDVAAALVATVLQPHAEGIFIVNTPAPLARLLAWMADEVGVPAPAVRIPLAVGRALAWGGDRGRRLLGREPPFSSERLREMTNTTCYDGTAITRMLGFAYPQGIEAAVRGFVRAYRTGGLL